MDLERGKEVLEHGRHEFELPVFADVEIVQNELYAHATSVSVSPKTD